MPVDVDELAFQCEGAWGAVPAVAWLPDAAGPVPVVLLGHGGSGSKRSPRIERLGRWFARHGLAALAIDGPFHGDRVDALVAAGGAQRMMTERGAEVTTAGMVQDWTCALAALEATGRVDPRRCAYLGLSLGSRFGMPLAASLGVALRCAVFGKFGLEETVLLPRGLGTPLLTREAAEQIAAPVILSIRWDDELFPRRGALDLFDAIGSTDKTLVARPGRHAADHPDDEPMWCAFIRAHLLEPG